MFGLKLKAREKATREAAEIATVSSALREKLQREVVAALAFAFSDQSISQTDRDEYAVKAAAVRDGIDSVLIEGADAFGPDIAATAPPMRCGAMLAHAARNLALLSGTTGIGNARGDINFGIYGRRDL